MRGSSSSSSQPGCGSERAATRPAARRRATIVRSFTIRKRVPPRPIRSWRKSTGPRDVELDRERRQPARRQREHEHDDAIETSIVRLSNRDDGVSAGGLMPRTVIPSTSSISTDGPEDVDELGQDADADVERP